MFLLKSSLGTFRESKGIYMISSFTTHRAEILKQEIRMKTYINYIILGIVSVGSTDVEAVASVHRLHDSDVISAVKKLSKQD